MSISFKELLLESKEAIIFVNRGFSATNSCKVLSEKETEKIMNTLKNHKRANYELKYFIDSVEERSNEALVIKYGSTVFPLFAERGRLKLGIDIYGSSLCKLVKNININDLNKALKDAKVI
jgi:hypothetical protein